MSYKMDSTFFEAANSISTDFGKQYIEEFGEAVLEAVSKPKPPRPLDKIRNGEKDNWKEIGTPDTSIKVKDSGLHVITAVEQLIAHAFPGHNVEIKNFVYGEKVESALVVYVNGIKTDVNLATYSNGLHRKDVEIYLGRRNAASLIANVIIEEINEWLMSRSNKIDDISELYECEL